MNSVIAFLMKHLGIQELAQIALPIEIEELQTQDRAAIVRALSLSENTVRGLCLKSGVDPVAQLAKRDAAANAFADFILGFAPPADPATDPAA